MLENKGRLKKKIESVITIIPRRTTPPLFFENCDSPWVFFAAFFD